LTSFPPLSMSCLYAQPCDLERAYGDRVWGGGVRCVFPTSPLPDRLSCACMRTTLRVGLLGNTPYPLCACLPPPHPTKLLKGVHVHSDYKPGLIEYILHWYAMVPTQEAKYIEGWPNMPSDWAGWSRFDISVNRYGGVHSLLQWPSRTLGSPTCH
jgi:hypothetical protein